MSGTYYSALGGHPPQTQLLTGRAIFTEAYAVIPKGVMQDIVTSLLPHWEQDTRLDHRAPALRLCRNLLTIHHGSRHPAAAAPTRSLTPRQSACCFFVAGGATVTIAGKSHNLQDRWLRLHSLRHQMDIEE